MISQNWAKSSRSQAQQACVEARGVRGPADTRAVEVRDTKDRDGGTLGFCSADWTAFVGALKAGSIA